MATPDGELQSRMVERDLDAAIAELQAQGYRLDVIMPADNPTMAEMSRRDERLRLIVEGAEHTPPNSGGVFSDEFVLTSDDERDAARDAGRAGMRYRDLIPNRHGGHVIASHITIPGSGPVADYVHHHDIAFQVIFVKSGRVEVVYEDQGDPFWMEAGDCVLQPPHIRHRVLESADNCEVIEVASPAAHPTFVEHDIDLPTDTVEATRNFGGQRFCFSQDAEAEWLELAHGWVERVLGIGVASGGVGEVRVLRSTQSSADHHLSGHHDGTLCLFFVLEGELALDTGLDGGTSALVEGDAVSIPRATTWKLLAAEPRCSILQITMS